MLDERLEPDAIENYDTFIEYQKELLEGHNDSFVNAQIDALTLTFNISYDHFDLFRGRCLMRKNHYFLDKTEDSFIVRFDEHSFFEVNLNLKNRNNARLDFNPSFITEDVEKFIIDVVLKDIDKVRISRIDIALDYSEDLSDYCLQTNKHALKSDDLKELREIRGLRSILETRYIGSRKNRMYRQYNKKLERQEKADVQVKYDNLWRIEAEVRSEKYLKDIRSIFKGIYLKNINFENIDIFGLNNETVKNIYFLLHAENAEKYLDARTVKKLKKIIDERNTNMNIDLNRDFELVEDKLFWDLRKFGVQL